MAVLVAASGGVSGRKDVVNEVRTLEWRGRARTYALFVPPRPKGTAGYSVVVLQHGTGGSGPGMVEAWKPLAESQHLILVAPNGLGKYGWSVPDDGPELQEAILKQVAAEFPLDDRRLYLFGFSAGGDFVFYAALQQSRYFAGACVHLASLRPRQFPMLDLAERQIPLYYSAGIEDKIFPLAEATATEAEFQRRKWPFKYVNLPIGHEYDPSDINPRCWDFLKKQALAEAPASTPLTPQWLGYALY